MKARTKIWLSALGVGILIAFTWLFSDTLYWLRRAKRDAASAMCGNERTMDSIITGVQAYYDFHHFVPGSLADLQHDTLAKRSWVQLTHDVWNRPVQYSVDSSGQIVRVWSYGKDGRLGGTGVDQDIVRTWSTTNKTGIRERQEGAETNATTELKPITENHD